MPTEAAKKPRRARAGGVSPNVADLQKQIADLQAQLAESPGRKAATRSASDKVIVLNLSRTPLTIIPADGTSKPIRIGPGPVKDAAIPDEYEPSATVRRCDVSGPAWDDMVARREIEIREVA